MRINGNSTQGIFAYSDNYEYERGDFVIYKDTLYKCIAEDSEVVCNSKPDEDRENFEEYPGSRIRRKEDYLKELESDSDRYVSSDLLNQVLSDTYFGMNESGLISSKVSLDDKKVSYDIKNLRGDYTLGNTDILNTILKEESLNNGAIKVSTGLPEIENLLPPRSMTTTFLDYPLTGSIVDFGTGEGVGNVIVREVVYGSIGDENTIEEYRNNETRSDKSGEFTINISSDNSRLEIIGPKNEHYITKYFDLSDVSGAYTFNEETHEVILRDPIKIQKEGPFYSVSGTVTDYENNALKGITVKVDNKECTWVKVKYGKPLTNDDERSITTYYLNWLFKDEIPDEYMDGTKVSDATVKSVKDHFLYWDETKTYGLFTYPEVDHSLEADNKNSIIESSSSVSTSNNISTLISSNTNYRSVKNGEEGYGHVTHYSYDSNGDVKLNRNDYYRNLFFDLHSPTTHLKEGDVVSVENCNISLSSADFLRVYMKDRWIGKDKLKEVDAGLSSTSVSSDDWKLTFFLIPDEDRINFINEYTTNDLKKLERRTVDLCSVYLKSSGWTKDGEKTIVTFQTRYPKDDEKKPTKTSVVHVASDYCLFARLEYKFSDYVYGFVGYTDIVSNLRFRSSETLTFSVNSTGEESTTPPPSDTTSNTNVSSFISLLNGRGFSTECGISKISREVKTDSDGKFSIESTYPIFGLNFTDTREYVDEFSKRRAKYERVVSDFLNVKLLTQLPYNNKILLNVPVKGDLWLINYSSDNASESSNSSLNGFTYLNPNSMDANEKKVKKEGVEPGDDLVEILQSLGNSGRLEMLRNPIFLSFIPGTGSGYTALMNSTILQTSSALIGEFQDFTISIPLVPEPSKSMSISNEFSENTLGYKVVSKYFDKEISLDELGVDYNPEDFKMVIVARSGYVGDIYNIVPTYGISDYPVLYEEESFRYWNSDIDLSRRSGYVILRQFTYEDDKDRDNKFFTRVQEIIDPQYGNIVYRFANTPGNVLDFSEATISSWKTATRGNITPREKLESLENLYTRRCSELSQQKIELQNNYSTSIIPVSSGMKTLQVGKNTYPEELTGTMIITLLIRKELRTNLYRTYTLTVGVSTSQDSEQEEYVFGSEDATDKITVEKAPDYVKLSLPGTFPGCIQCAQYKKKFRN